MIIEESDAKLTYLSFSTCCCADAERESPANETHHHRTIHRHDGGSSASSSLADPASGRGPAAGDRNHPGSAVQALSALEQRSAPLETAAPVRGPRGGGGKLAAPAG